MRNIYFLLSESSFILIFYAFNKMRRRIITCYTFLHTMYLRFLFTFFLIVTLKFARVRNHIHKYNLLKLSILTLSIMYIISITKKILKKIHIFHRWKREKEREGKRAWIYMCLCISSYSFSIRERRLNN